jgi:hypothetical protein
VKKGLKIVLIAVFVLFFLAISLIVLKPFLSRGKLFAGYYLTYQVNEDSKTCTVTKHISLGEKDVVIPEQIGRYRVTAIGEYAFANRQKLKSISLPSSITTIGMGAFYECSGLAEINIPKSITSIGSYAFYGCSALKSITLPETIQAIGAGVLEGCSTLTEANVPASAIYSLPADNITSVVINSGTSIGTNAFQNFEKLKNIIIAPTVQTVGTGLFQKCKNITYATVPTCVLTELPKDALTHVVINGGTHIPEKAFLYAPNLTSVTVSHSVESIGKMAFSGCYKLVEVYNLSSIDIKKGDTGNGGIGRYALNIYTSTQEKSKTWTDENGYLFFEDGETCYLLGFIGKDKNLVLPQNCHGKPYLVHQYAFYNDAELATVTIPEGVLGVDAYAFYHCASLTSVFLPDGLVTIGEYAFADCENLKEISFAKETTMIGAFAFEDCDHLMSVHFRGTTEEWKSVTQGYNWMYYAPAKEVVCSDGTIPLK